MAAKRKGLGRGLSALMDEMGAAAAPAGEGLAPLPVGLIDANPDQPRRNFDEGELRELADSIRTRGVLQPILVRPAGDGRYQIVAGERRWRACQLAGLHELPAIIRDFSESDSYEAAIIENVQRADLDPLEEAQGYRRLIAEYGHTQEMVAAATGKSRSHVANLLRLLELPEAVQALLHDGLLTVGHAKAVLQAADPIALAQLIVAEGLTVRAAEAAARRSHEPRRPAKAPAAPARDADIELLETELKEALGMPVQVRAKGNRGTLTIRYSSLDQLDHIIQKLQP